MGHKRKKFSERVADREAKGRDESPFKKSYSDTPKGFERIMFKKDSIAQRMNEKRQAGSTSEDLGASKKGKNNNNNNNNKDKDKKSSTSATDELRIKPGERMGDFSRRVDEHMRDKLQKATRSNSATASKKKKYYEKLKAKEQAKKLKQQEENAYKEYETIHDKVQLNDVAEAPPSLTVVPKKRRNDEFMANKKWKNTPGEEDFEDVVAGLDPAKKRKLGADDDAAAKGKSRLKNMTPAGRRIMEEERKQAIENYRLMKARKALERNPGIDADAEADDAAAAEAGY
ncbi:hypothetical protein BG011_001668 [Mortierella polycephala]|uniref:Uncharacterized protein n=1 Tax=Mortierella polycephala TaxID=41804 RepID=A0A9P6U623_9FUNG|nr:hypothetical protein BG011_001668 [Mortierella polycephala]